MCHVSNSHAGTDMMEVYTQSRKGNMREQYRHTHTHILSGKRERRRTREVTSLCPTDTFSLFFFLTRAYASWIVCVCVCVCVCVHFLQVPANGAELAYLVCGGCRTLLSYARGASSVQCSECSTVNLAIQAHQIAHVTCGGCNVTLMYAQGAASVSCAQCGFVTNVSAQRQRQQNEAGTSQAAGGGGAGASSSSQREMVRTVVVQNPDTLDEQGRLVHSIAVGVTSELEAPTQEQPSLEMAATTGDDAR